MAVLQRVALYPKERLDIPDARANEAFSANDWRFFINGVMANTSVVIAGFEITNFQNVYSVQGIKISQNNVSLLHPEATTQACGFYVSTGSESDAEIVLSANTTNYIEADLESVLGTPDVRAFWDSEGADGTKGAEYTTTVDTVIDLNLKITANTSGFTSGKIPLYKITTNNDRVATSVTDCRPLMFRLGKGGSSPNAFYSFEWPSVPNASQARIENPSTTGYASTQTNNRPFLGGDKNLKSLKQWMDAMMSGIKEINSTPFWYMKPSASLAQVYQNAAMTTLQGGTWEHLKGSPGRLKLVSGTTLLRFGLANSFFQPFSVIDLANKRTLYVLLTKDGSAATYGMGRDGQLPVNPRIVSLVTKDEIQVDEDGNYLSSGKLLIKGVEFSYTSFNTSTKKFGGVSPDPTGLVKDGDRAFQATQNGVGYYMYGSPQNLPSVREGISEGVETVFWLAHFDGTGTIIIRDSELVAGESAQVGNDESIQLFQYIGSQGPADNFPIYDGTEPNLQQTVQVQSIPQGTNLTDAISAAWLLLEKKIYDEAIDYPNGATAGSVIYLPDHSKYLPATVGAKYTMGTDELEVYRDGVRLEKDQDYTELTNNSIQLLRDVFADTRLRFRIAQVGGAGAASGGSSGLSLQSAYSNGSTITAAPNNPIIINASSQQEVLRVEGDVAVEGAISDVSSYQYDPQTSNPIANGRVGLWVDAAIGSLMLTKSDGTIINISDTIQFIGGSGASLGIVMDNKTGATIPAGSPVSISGANEVSLADADSPSAHRFFGIAAQSIPNNGSGRIIYQGVVPGILSGSGIVSGEYVWLGTTPGSMQDVPPSSQGTYLIIVGLCNGDDLILQQQTNGQVG